MSSEMIEHHLSYPFHVFSFSLTLAAAAAAVRLRHVIDIISVAKIAWWRRNASQSGRNKNGFVGQFADIVSGWCYGVVWTVIGSIG